MSDQSGNEREQKEPTSIHYIFAYLVFRLASIIISFLLIFVCGVIYLDSTASFDIMYLSLSIIGFVAGVISCFLTYKKLFPRLDFQIVFPWIVSLGVFGLIIVMTREALALNGFGVSVWDMKMMIIGYPLGFFAFLSLTKRLMIGKEHAISRHFRFLAKFPFRAFIPMKGGFAGAQGDNKRGLAAFYDGDYPQAFKWFRKGAEQGDAGAQFNLAGMYAEGEGVRQNYAEAVKWYRKAAEQGDVDAQNNLGGRYSQGQGVPQDYDEAMKWYRKAAEQGNAGAQFQLGIMFDLGRGVQIDNRIAYMWYSLAATQGHEASIKIRDSLFHKLTPQQISEAEASINLFQLSLRYSLFE